MDLLKQVVNGFLMGFGATFGYFLAKVIIHLCGGQI